MVDERVLGAAKGLTEYYGRLLPDFPKYRLDYSWPSIGTLDLITSALRSSKSYSAAETQLLQGAAAYLAGMAYDCWSQFPDKLKVEISMLDDSGDIVLSASGGKLLLNSQTFAVNISQSLRTILQDPPQPFPYFGVTSRVLPEDHNRLSLFASGLCTGWCPWGAGLWKEQDEKKLKQYFFTSQAYLTSSCVRYYKGSFPSESLGLDVELYRQRVVLPPSGYNEQFPASHAALSVAKYFKDRVEGKEGHFQLVQNLSQIPDELISTVGFILSTALTKGAPSHDQILLADCFGEYRNELRPALSMVRRKLGLPHDPLFEFGQGREQIAREILHTDNLLGFNPYLYFDLELLDNRQISLPLLTLIVGELDETKRVIKELLDGRFADSPELFLQAGLLELRDGNFDAAKELLNDLGKRGSLTQSAQARLDFLRAQLALEERETAVALQYIREAAKLGKQDPVFHSRAALSLTAILTAEGAFTEALGILDFINDSTYVPLGAYLMKILVLQQLGDEIKAEEVVEKIIRKAPWNRALFQELIRIRSSRA